MADAPRNSHRLLTGQPVVRTDHLEAPKAETR